MPPVDCAKLATATMIVPPGEIELHIALGWRLTDEPHCSGAFMLPPATFAQDFNRHREQ